jgi:putative ABC transport system substrate-binding protein
MKRRDFIALVGGAVSAALSSARAQAMPAVGFLGTGFPGPAAPFLGAFRRMLGSAGFVEGRTIAIEYRWAEGRYDRLEALAADLVRRDVVVIAATGGTVAAKAAKMATSKIPILFVAGFDPVQEGLVAQINRPGGNATGIAVYSASLGPKRLSLLKEILPGTARTMSVSMLVNPDAASTGVEIKDALDAAAGLNLSLNVLHARTNREIEAAFAESANAGASGLIISGDSFFTNQRVEIVALAARHKLPVCYPWPQYVELGGLISYGTSLIWAYEQLGSYAVQILKGADPNNLPVQFPTRFETAINLSTAKELALNIPATLLGTADSVIE